MSRRRPRWALVTVAAPVLVGLALALWYLGEERRLGRVVAALVRARTGLAVSVGGASAEGGRLTLRDVRIGASPGLPVEARVGRVEVSGGWLPLVAPRSGPLSVRAVAAQVSVADGASGAPTARTVEPLRAALRDFLEWPGTLALRVEEGELHAGGRSWALDLGADKHATRLTLTLALTPAGAPPVLRAQVDAAADGPTTVALRGRFVLGDPEIGPAVLEASGRWGPDGRLEVAPWVFEWGPDVRLEGRATLSAAGGAAAARADAEGEVAGSRVAGRLAWDADHGLVAHATLREVDPGRLGARLGVVLPARSALRLDISLDATLRGSHGALRPPSVETARIAVHHRGRTLAQGTLASRAPDRLWPIDGRVTVEDTAALAALVPVPATATGTVSVSGEIEGAAPLRARGTVQASLDAVELQLGGTVRLADLSVTVPWVLGGEPPPGTLGIARVSAWGLAITDVTAAVQQQAERLLISALRYRHAGGHGAGWAEWTPGGRPALRVRLEAERVDLGRVVQESGLGLAQVTGTVRYTALAQHSPETGLSALARVAGESGGQVSVEAVQRLLDAGPVQGGDSWLVRQTLENLRVFRYEALDAEVRWAGGAGHLDLTLRGRKRLGLFPGPVEAVNLRHVPLTWLLRTLGRSTRP